mgnify:CR=1 FL=1
MYCFLQGADEAGAKLAELDCFKNAKSIKVNLDKPQGEVRYLTLEVIISDGQYHHF